MPKTLVTGGLGFVGSNLVDRLVKRGDEVVVIDNLSTGKWDNHSPRAKYLIDDICDALSGEISFVAKAEGFWDDIDVIYHLAALPRIQYSLKFPGQVLHNNVHSTLRVLEFARNTG